MTSKRTIPQKLQQAFDKFSPRASAKGLCSELRGLLQELDRNSLELERHNRKLQKAQQELKVAHHRVVDLFDNSPIGYISMDPEGLITAANAKACRILDRVPETLLGKSLGEFVAGADREKLSRHLSMSQTGDREVATKLHFTAPGGGDLLLEVVSERWSSAGKDAVRTEVRTALINIGGLKKRPARNADEVPSAAHGRKTASSAQAAEKLPAEPATMSSMQEALRQSEERLRLHVENSPLAVVEWERGDVVRLWSKEAVRMFGWTAEEAIGKMLGELKLVHPDDAEIVARTGERLNSGNESAVVSENRNVTKDGRVLSCVWYNSVLRGPDGQMTSVLSLVQDVTRERIAMATLERTVNSLGVLVSNSQESMVLFDQEGKILCASERAAASIESTPGDLEGKTWSAFLPGEQLIHARLCFADLLKNPSAPTTTTLKLRTSSGTVTWFGLLASVVSLGASFGFLVHLERI